MKTLYFEEIVMYKRRVYNREFKINSVRLIIENKFSFSHTAAVMGINESMLRRWHKEFINFGNKAFPGHG